MFFIILVLILFLAVIVLSYLLLRKGREGKPLPVDIDLYLLVDKETGLYNRRFFTKRILEEIHRFERYRAPFTIAILQLPPAVKELKDDKLGRLLRRLGSIIEKDTRLTDLVSRFGREDIGVLFSMTGRRGADVPVYRLKDKIEAVLKEDGIEGEARFAVYSYPEQSEKIKKFLDKIKEGSI
jgi:diguanylate cyclase (GGDEF)-like protein